MHESHSTIVYIYTQTLSSSTYLLHAHDSSHTTVFFLHNYDDCFYYYNYNYDVYNYKILILYVNSIIMIALTLRTLSLFLKILPISNTGVSAIRYLPLLAFCTPNLAPFPTWSTTSRCLLNETRKSPSAS